VLAVVAIIVDVVAPADGTIARVDVAVGDTVEAASAIAWVGDPRRVAEIAEAVERAARAVDAYDRVATALAEGSPAIVALEAELDAARVTFARIRQLRELSEITNREWAAAVDVAEAAKAASAELAAERAAPLRWRTRGTRLRAELAAATRRRDRAWIRAGAAGTVDAVLVAPGDRVVRGQVIARVVSDDP
jgi:multidrug resistance efflux pump